MNLYLLTQTKVRGYETYNEAVVVAVSAMDAATIHPDKRVTTPAGALTCLRRGEVDCPHDFDAVNGRSWCEDTEWCKPEDVTVTFLGDASGSLSRGVVTASFNAA